MKPLLRLLENVLLRNSAAILGARLVTPLAFFGLSIAVARILGPDSLGRFATIMSLYAIFSLVSSLGLENLLLREVAKAPEKAGTYLSHTLILGLISSLACALSMAAAANLLDYAPDVRRHLLWLALAFLPGFVNIVAELILIALGRAGHAFVLALVREGSMIVLSLVWMTNGWGLRGVVVALIVSRVLGCGVAFLSFAWLRIAVWTKFEPEFLTRLVKLIPTFVVINLLSNVLLEIDIVILSKLAPSAEVGRYMIAKKLVRSSFHAVYSVITALTPSIARAFHHRDPDVEPMFDRLWWRLLAASAGLSVLMFALAEWAIHLTYGPRYAAAVGLMHILTWMMIPLSLSFLASRFLIAGDQQRKDLLALTIATVTLVAVGIPAVRTWGVHGMAFTSLSSTVFLTLLHLALVKRSLFGARAQRGASEQ